MRLLVFSCLVSLSVGAQEIGAPAEVVKERQALMKAMGAHMKALGPLASKKVAVAGHAEVHAKAIVELTRLMKDLFPKGTGPATGLSDAKEAVWTDEKKFAAAIQDMASSADGLLKAAQSGEGLKAALDTTNDSCVGCHKPFRANR